MMISSTKKLAGIAAVAALFLGLTACGSSAEAADSADSGTLKEVTVGILPTVDLAPLMYAVNEGIFEDHGLKVETRVTSGGSESIPALAAGDVDFIFTSYIPVLLAKQSGIDVVIASGSHTNTPGEDVPSGVWTSADSGIKTMSDLKGKTISVNALGSVGELLIVSALAEVGLSENDYSLLEIPFPDVPAALDQGRVDAVWVAEPGRTTIANDMNGVFVGSAEDPSVMSVDPVFQDFPLAGYAARGNEDPETLDAFHEAMAEALEVLAEEPEIARTQATEYTKIPENLLADITVSTFGPLSSDDIKRLESLMVEQEMLEAPLENVEQLVYTPSSK